MALVFFEWFRIVGTRSLGVPCWTVGAVTIGLTGLCILMDLFGYGLAVCAAGAATLVAIRLAEGRDFWPSVGIVYAGIAGVAFVALRDSGELGFAVIIFLFAVIWSTDVFAFFGGRQFGGPRLAPVVSPKKTWSGFASGLAGGILAGIIAAALLTAADLVRVALLAALVSVAGQAGDLFESAFKRQFGVKDSGSLIPGHGGVMDRVDSLIFAAFAAYIVALVLPGQGPAGSSNGIAMQLLGH
jgi:phosphatidate cytidylyltransferase